MQAVDTDPLAIFDAQVEAYKAEQERSELRLSSGLVAAPPPVINRYDWVDLPDLQYPGYRFRMWVNFPSSLMLELHSGHEARTMAALHRIVREHNHWSYQDEETGEVREYPPCTEDAFWSEIPTELSGCIFALIDKTAAKLPNSIRLAKGS